MMFTAKIVLATDEYQVVEIESSKKSYLPEVIPEIIALVDELKVDTTKGVVISHRGAVWVHGALSHHLHICKWVAHFDPRVGAVITQSHTPNYVVGQVITLPVGESAT